MVFSGDLPTEKPDGAFAGDFALALLRGQDLVLARGLFGGRPLYYTRSDSLLVACSRLEPLVGLLDERPEPDAVRFASLATFAIDEPERTSFRNISRVLSGESIRIEPSGALTKSRMRFVPTCLPLKTPAAYAEALREQIDLALARATAGKRRVAILVSGGLDSSALLAAQLARARGASPAEVTAISLEFAASSSDTDYRRALCEALAIVPVVIRPEDCRGSVEDALVVDAAPMPGCGAAELGLMRKARELGVDVVLSGAGGDDLLDRDFDFIATLARSGAWASSLAWALRLRGAYWMPSRLTRAYRLAVRPAVGAMLPRAALAWLRRRRVVAALPDWAGPLMRAHRDATPSEAESVPLEATSDARVRSLAHAWFNVEVSDARAQFELASGIERRDLFLDPELASFVAQVPADILMHDGWLRGLLRLAFRGEIPDAVRLRTNKGQFEPAFDAFLAELGHSGLLAQLARGRELGRLGVIEPTAFARAISRLRAGMSDDGAHHTKLWPLLGSEYLLQRLRCEVPKRCGRPQSAVL